MPNLNFAEALINRTKRRIGQYGLGRTDEKQVGAIWW